MNFHFAALPLLFLVPPDSDLSLFLEEACGFAARHPDIVARINADLDRHSLNKKSLRLRDAQWERERDGRLPGVAVAGQAEVLSLDTGRPRTPGILVFLAVALRGYQGGFSSCETETLMLESMTWRVVVENLGCAVPKAGTLADLANQVSPETRQWIFDKQIEDVQDAGLDDFKQFLADSTSVKGNTQWPKDSHLMVLLAERVLHLGGRLAQFGLPALSDARAAKRVKQMRYLDKEISFGVGKPGSEAERTRQYGELLQHADKVHRSLASRVARVCAALETLKAKPSVHERAVRVVDKLKEDIANLASVMASCRARVVESKKVPMAEKVLSVSDKDAAFIVKGGREAVVGYKPQLARSGKGFVVGFILPKGNAADSTQLEPLFDQAVERTGVIPDVVSVDDGYSCDDVRFELLSRDVKVVSMNGSKGKRITPEEDWDSPEYAAARNNRSAMESIMFTLKDGFDFGRMVRRGLKQVTAEMLEKILAYNFCRMARRRQEDREGAEAEPATRAA